ncbi:MFS transporter [Robertmurraya sp. DFI.2.37]|uniref:MFS transporter n=1 Tax=Robertmurraya sp. DFI.2.37 TaxID=3031819 RepID=UPI001244F22F|nr:MFS transporter [Robertmurraya sp. DFI.2.37]MDF1508832.1 MFS transporter [Robertmurraya sp. DFI.2.37]
MNIKNIYYLVTSSRAFMIQMVFTLNAIYYVTQAELNPLQLVLVGTIMELSILLFEMPTGLVADFFGRKKSLVVGTFILGAAHLLEGSFPEFWAIAIGAILWGLVWTFISGAEEAWISDELESKELERVFLKGAQYSSIGRFSGIIASVLLAALFSVQATILTAGGLLLLLSLLSMLVPETKFISAADNGFTGLGQMTLALKGGVSHIKGNKVLVGIAFITLLWGLASEGFDRLWGAHFIAGFHLTEEDSIYWFGAFYAIAFLLNLAMLKIVEFYVKGSYALVLFLFNSVLTMAILLFAFTNNFFIAVLLYWAIASLRNVNSPLMSVMINKRLPSQGRATALSMFGQLDALGQVAGGPLVGIVALYTSVQVGMASSTLLIIPTLYFLWSLRKVT